MATYANISIDQGSNFTSTIEIEDAAGDSFNLSSYDVRGQIRKTFTSANAVDLDVTVSEPTKGEITMELSATDTASLKAGRYVYDVEIYDNSGYVLRVLEGQVLVNPRVTQSSDSAS